MKILILGAGMTGSSVAEAFANEENDIVVVDFKHWKLEDGNKLSRVQDGKWEKRLGLSPGQYKYKFVVDGEWVLDSKNSERIQNAFGTFDSIIQL